MESKRYYLEGNDKPDLVIIPVENREVRENANYLEKMLFYREISATKLKILVSSKKLIERIGGFDPKLGFGEDKLFQEKAFDLLEVNKETRKKFEI